MIIRQDILILLQVVQTYLSIYCHLFIYLFVSAGLQLALRRYFSSKP